MLECQVEMRAMYYRILVTILCAGAVSTEHAREPI